MATYYVDSGAGVVEYSAKTWSVGEKMVPTQADATTNHLVAKQWVWECTTGGTSAATPAWPASVTDAVTTVTDSGVVWTAHAPTSWTYAMPGLYWLAADATTKKLVGGDTVYMSSTHASPKYTGGVLIRLPSSGAVVNIISVTSGTTTPAVGALEQSASGAALNLYGYGYLYGVVLKSGDGATAANIGFSGGGRPALLMFNKCEFNLSGTSAGSSVMFNGDYSVGKHVVNECTFRFGNVGCTIGPYALQVFTNCSLAGSSPTCLLTGANLFAEFIGCDLSSCSTISNEPGTNPPSYVKFVNCKVPSSLHGANYQSSVYREFFSCSSADHNYDYAFFTAEGVVQDSQSIYLTTGGSQMKDVDGTLVSYSLEANPSTSASKAFPLYTPWTSVFNSSTGSKTVSMKVAYDSATALKDTECWIEVEYYGDSTTPMSTVEVSAPVVSGTKSRDILAAGSSLTDTSAGWTGTGGWTNKKTATLSKTVTINQQGYVRARVAVAVDTTVYVDQVVGVA